MNHDPRVLVVDDEEIVRLNIERILEEKYIVKTCASAESAVAAINQEHFDLVLTDLVMEGMSGLALLDEIKRHDPDIVVIIISGYGSLPSAVSAMQRGAYDYILKPCSREELLVRVEKGLEKGELDKKLMQIKEMETVLSNIGAFILDNKGTIISANNPLKAKIWGDMEVEGKKLQELPYVDDNLIKDFNHALQGETIEQESYKIPLQDSWEGLIVSYKLKPMTYKNNAIASLIWIVEDVTKRTRIMNQINQAEKLSALGKLAAGVAHEINNPLNIISLDVEFVKGQLEPTDPIQENLESISDEVDRIARIVQQLQEQTRTQESLQEGSDLEKILNNHIFQIVFAQLFKKGIKVHLDLEKDQGDLLIPKSKLTQVLMNLVKNAEDAMPDGGSLTIASRSVSCNAGEESKCPIGARRDKYAQIILSDTGLGIKKEHISYIFEPFFSTKGFEGTGLGLFISYTIIKGYHGNLQVESKENSGAVFTISLPLTAKEGLQNEL